MFTKDFLNDKVATLLHDYVKDELFSETIGLKMPTGRGSSSYKTFLISCLMTGLSQEDSERLSIETDDVRTIDLFKEDLEQLKADNPSEFIVTNNFQNKISIIIDNKEYKVREERNKQGFDNIIRLICERQTM